jgi:hypothetical protein
LTAKRSRRLIENDEYGAFVWRILCAYSRRVGVGDVEALVLMLGLAKEIHTVIAVAVEGLRASGYSWAEIGPGSASPARPPSNDGECRLEQSHADRHIPFGLKYDCGRRTRAPGESTGERTREVTLDLGAK